MKTNPTCLLLLTIALGVQGALAGRPGAPSVKMPSMNIAVRQPTSMPSMQKMRPVAPRQRAAVPSARLIKPTAPPIRMTRPLAPPVRMVKPTAPPVRMTRPIAPPIQMTRPAVKAPVQIKPILRSPALVKPTVRPNLAVNPSVRAKVPSFPPAIAKVPSLPPAVKRPPAIVKPAGNGGPINVDTGNGTPISPAAPAPTGNNAGSSPIPDGLNESLAGIQEGMAIADQLNQMRDLQFGGLQTGLPDGLQDPFGGNSGTAPRGPGQPNTDLDDAMGYSPREPHNPLDRNSRPGTGLTDIRPGAYASRDGQESDSTVSRSRGRDMSPTGRDLVQGGSRSGDRTSYGRIERSGGSYDLVGVRDTPLNNGDARADTTSVSEHHDSSGAITGYTEHRSTDGTNGSYTDETVHRDAQGNAQDVVVVEHNGQTNTDTKTVYNPDGSVRSQSRGLHPDDAAANGPVNGTQGSLRDQLGLKPLDFLRQPTEDEQSGGGTNRMTGQSGGIQVRPANPNENPAPNTNRNRLPSDRFGNIINPGTIDTSTGGNPRD